MYFPRPVDKNTLLKLHEMHMTTKQETLDQAMKALEELGVTPYNLYVYTLALDAKESKEEDESTADRLGYWANYPEAYLPDSDELLDDAAELATELGL